MTLDEGKKELCRKLDIDYATIASNQLFSDTDLLEWINLGILRAWDYKPWDFTEWAKTGAIGASEYTNGYIDYPTDFVSGTVWLIKIATKKFRKIRFADFLQYQEDFPSGADKVCAEHRRFIFFNKNACAQGNAVDFYGKKKATQVVNATDLFPFSPDTDNNEYSGNQAIVLLAYSEALASDKKKDLNRSVIEEKRAYQILDILWKEFSENRSLDQSKNNPIFDVPDYFGKGSNSNNAGKFSI